MKKLAILTDYGNAILLTDVRYLYETLKKIYKVEVLNYFEFKNSHDYTAKLLDFDPDLLLCIGVVPVVSYENCKTIIWDYFGDFYVSTGFGKFCNVAIICNKDIDTAKKIKKEGANVKRLYPISALPRHSVGTNNLQYDCFMALDCSDANKLIIRQYIRLFYYLVLHSDAVPNIYSDFDIFSNIKMIDTKAKEEDLHECLSNSKSAFVFNGFKAGFNYPMLVRCANYHLPIITNHLSNLEFESVIDFNTLTIDQMVIDMNTKWYSEKAKELKKETEEKINNAETIGKLTEIINDNM
tara:strand:- start:9263 stop:10150 length:888 start_codon:yes stop_codon:yes gene_type:complete